MSEIFLSEMGLKSTELSKRQLINHEKIVLNYKAQSLFGNMKAKNINIIC